jgi:hypothetical protein
MQLMTSNMVLELCRYLLPLQVVITPKYHMYVSRKQPLAEMQGKVAYIRPKVVGPFPGSYASWSYVHRAALFYDICMFSLFEGEPWRNGKVVSL